MADEESEAVQRIPEGTDEEEKGRALIEACKAWFAEKLRGVIDP